jgi:hypothetical protein
MLIGGCKLRGAFVKIISRAFGYGYGLEWLWFSACDVWIWLSMDVKL